MPQWIGGPEFLILVLVIVVVFGWKKLPDAARSLGRSMRIFKSEVSEMKHDTAAPARQTLPTQPSPSVPPTGTTGDADGTPAADPSTGAAQPTPSTEPGLPPRS